LHWAVGSFTAGEESHDDFLQSIRILLNGHNHLIHLPDAMGETPLEIAIISATSNKWTAEKILFLVNEGADCRFKTRYGGKTVMQLLMTFGSAFDWTSKNSVFRNILEAVLERGVDLWVGRPEDWSETLLHMAVCKFNLEIVECVLQRCQPSLVSWPDARALNTPLHAILEATPPPIDHRAIVQSLISANADLFARNRKHRTPLLCACANPHIESSVLFDLVRAGSDVNDEAEPGETPMSLVFDCMIDIESMELPRSELWSRLCRKVEALEETGIEMEPYLTSTKYCHVFAEVKMSSLGLAKQSINLTEVVFTNKKRKRSIGRRQLFIGSYSRGNKRRVDPEGAELPKLCNYEMNLGP
jgi:hypothetical protein